mmetsp:Transcript_68780/g.201426  ORF Transcript_68780/g.201426 Transcript_68780/m.201426 type:complete len:308 (+) Transcript_68780:2764-3687(+)
MRTRLKQGSHVCSAWHGPMTTCPRGTRSSASTCSSRGPVGAGRGALPPAVLPAASLPAPEDPGGPWDFERACSHTRHRSGAAQPASRSRSPGCMRTTGASSLSKPAQSDAATSTRRVTPGSDCVPGLPPNIAYGLSGESATARFRDSMTSSELRSRRKHSARLESLGSTRSFTGIWPWIHTVKTMPGAKTATCARRCSSMKLAWSSTTSQSSTLWGWTMTEGATAASVTAEAVTLSPSARPRHAAKGRATSSVPAARAASPTQPTKRLGAPGSALPSVRSSLSGRQKWRAAPSEPKRRLASAPWSAT